jgi:hypothetical protein
MPNCPICNSNLPKPPEDVQDWFRCETCGTPLRVSTTVGKIIFGFSVAILLITFWTGFGLLHHLSKFNGLSVVGEKLLVGSMFTIVAGIYAFLIRLLWKSKLFQPRPCDPYSSLNLSDDRKKLRGNASHL